MRIVLALSPKVGAGCGSAARPDLCGGRRVTGVETQTASIERSQVPSVASWLLDCTGQHEGASPASGLGRPEIDADGAKRTRP